MSCCPGRDFEGFRGNGKEILFEIVDDKLTSNFEGTTKLTKRKEVF
jgi:hypothetical protein